MKCNVRQFLLVIVLLSIQACRVSSQEPLDNQIRFDRATVFDEVSKAVEQHFYRRDFDTKKWQEVAEVYRKQCLTAPTHDEFTSVINKLLKTLDASHTYYFSKLNPKRYQLLGVFHRLFSQRTDSFFQYDGIGIDAIRDDENWRVVAVFDGMPAEYAGLKFADQIVSVDDQPFHPILSFRGKSNCQVTINRDGYEQTLSVKVETLDGRNMFEEAMKASSSLLQRNGKSIGYIHAWCYAGLKYQDILREHLLWGKLKDCDSLILDLRDGWGGADINYLNLFREPIANIQSSSRNSQSNNFTGVWGKPVSLLTNQRSTSGKELFAYGFKKLKLGTIIGEKSAGAVVAGRCFLLSNEDVLYLAVMDVQVDGNRLEGVGVEPDFKVSRPIKSTSSDDPQLEKALQLLSK